jgi:hypothetical protein
VIASVGTTHQALIELRKAQENTHWCISRENRQRRQPNTKSGVVWHSAGALWNTLPEVSFVQETDSAN